MIAVAARSPVRISFGGGGTDLEAYYAPFCGFVVSTAITRYATVSVAPAEDGLLTIHSEDFGRTESCPAGALTVTEPLSLPKAVLAHFAERVTLPATGLSLSLHSDVPPGTGLGSSSAMTVALVRSLSAFLRVCMDRREVAEAACAIEIGRLGMPIGKQDQYASAFGGINAFTFSSEGVRVEPLELPPGVIADLESRLLLFSTGRSRHSGEILAQQRKDSGSNARVINSLHHIKALAYHMRDALRANDLDAFGRLLDEAWQHKKRLSGRISTGDIDRWYETARTAGALGGKITGAGGGGYLLLYVPPPAQHGVRAALTDEGLTELHVHFDDAGVHLLPALETVRRDVPAMAPGALGSVPAH